MKLLKKFFIITTFFILIFSSLFSSSSYASSNLASNTPDEISSSNKNLTINSEAAVLIDADHGKVLYDKDSTKKMYPASTTKVMTAILTVENCDLNAEVTVSYWAVNSVPYSYTVGYITPGQVYTVNELLNITMISSANDAAFVLAEYIANLDNPEYLKDSSSEAKQSFNSSIEKFANMMNEKAKEIGCTNTNFVNPNGIHNENHYSTAYDLALIGKYAYGNSIIRSIVSKTSYNLDKNTNHPVYNTTNALIKDSSKYYYQYANGLKTGYTDAAGYCIIASASKDNVNLICVILNGKYLSDGTASRESDCISLFNYGFENYKSVKLIGEGDIVRSIDIINGTDDTKKVNVIAATTLSCVIFTNEVIDVTPVIQYSSILAPIAKGQVIGKMTYTIDGISYSTDLIASNDVYSSNVMNIILALLGVFLILLIIVSIISIKKK